jgi:hypothetical protein
VVCLRSFLVLPSDEAWDVDGGDFRLGGISIDIRVACIERVGCDKGEVRCHFRLDR